jgi:acetamidase/formamidase
MPQAMTRVMGQATFGLLLFPVLGIGAFVTMLCPAARLLMSDGVPWLSALVPCTGPEGVWRAVGIWLPAGCVGLAALLKHPSRRTGEAARMHTDDDSVSDTCPEWSPAAMSDPQFLTVRPQPGEFAWTFGGAAPVARIAPGTVLDLYTEDCFAGRVRSEDDLVSQVCEFPFLNPQTGPFEVAGAEPGDTLAVHFVSIEPARDWAASTTVPLFGALTSTRATATLQPPLPEKVWIWQLDRDRRTARFSAHQGDFEAELPMDPMHGTVGVAPAHLEVRSALVPDAHGGNMDTPEMRAGVTCYLGVNVAGALFSLGDGHARQGEGETCGVAVECAMRTVVIVDLLKGVATPWPRIESDTHLISTGSARPLEDAFRISQLDLVQWLVRDYGFAELDAYQFLSQTVESPLANVCDTNYTCVAKLRKKWLPPCETHRGLHNQLRETAAALSL